MDPMFSPALHRQRHQFVVDFVKENKPKKVADLGCGECTLLKKLKFHREIELLVGVDINGAKVKKKMNGLAPISTDYLQPSYDQLRIELYQGSVTQIDARLRGFDLVTSIELIEHLSLAHVEKFSEVVFGYMTPLAVIVSTPNSDFNPLLPGLAGFRHSDHKFEWTRAEFRSWALKVCLEFGYEVEFTGVGQAPSGLQEQVGFCSQIGVFHRLGGRDGCNMLFGDDTEDVFSYTLLYSINYPSLRDNNILRRVLVSEVLYWAEKLKSSRTEQETDERSSVSGEESLLEQHMEMEELQTAACGVQMKNPLEQFVREKDEEVLRKCCQGQQESCTLNRCVPVSLAVLWSCCPKVSALSGSLSNLRALLMDEPKVKLSQDGSAVLLNYQEEEEEEEDPYDLEDSGYAEARQCSHSEEQEDWEANI
ncbi:small RNA 2'-O-methyltransferase [Anabas testudineus]|uniref:Small RNA 2'-O-methyltransferase n=1 Tax=Anabas testudineus TaxID=64144 RepID=A0A3Q1JB81_ANATE|nr:small RNA 2'-O-methyltransferase [Anabas testudineus]